MAKTQTIEIAPELQSLFDQVIKTTDPFVYASAGGKRQILSRDKKKLLRERSLFGFMSLLWATLNAGEKASWKTAAVLSNLTNWQFFISDNAARLRHDLQLVQPVSNDWQVNTGYIKIETPASELKIKQEHPREYWIAQKVAGKPWRKVAVLLTEGLALPIDILLSYKTDLTIAGGEQIARFYIRAISSFQGVNIVKETVIELNPSTDWVRETATLSSVIGYFMSYEVIVHIKGYTGEVFFDNIRVVHSGQNWARDPRCNEISKTFTRGFALVRPFWVPEVQPAGAFFSSLYPPSLD